MTDEIKNKAMHILLKIFSEINYDITETSGDTLKNEKVISTGNRVINILMDRLGLRDQTILIKLKKLINSKEFKENPERFKRNLDIIENKFKTIASKFKI